MKTILFILSLSILTNFTIVAQSIEGNNTITISLAKPEEAGMSQERLEKIDRMLMKAVEEKQIPGAVALIARNGKIVYHKAFGTSSANGNNLETDHIFRIASQTKAITATAVMMLWEEGRFQLDDPISRYIPEFKEPTILEEFNDKDSTFTSKPATRPITIRHLLTHTSGLGYGIIDSDSRMRKIFQKAGIIDAFTTKDVSIGENIKRLAKMPLHHEPGEKFTYGEGLDVLGYLVEILSGQGFDVYLKENIFDPLGMKDTYFYLPQNKSNRLVGIQEKVENNWVDASSPLMDVNFPINGARKFFSGGAGLSGTAKDYAAFLQMFLNGGVYNGNRLLSRTTVNMMMENQVGDLLGANGNRNYGIAFGILTPSGYARGGEGSTGTFDWGGYFNTQYFADPEENIIGILLKQTQGNTGDQTGWKFRQMTMAGIDD